MQQRSWGIERSVESVAQTFGQMGGEAALTKTLMIPRLLDVHWFACAPGLHEMHHFSWLGIK